MPEQPEAKRLLAAALAEGPRTRTSSTARRGVGKRARGARVRRRAARRRERVERGSHPDLYVLEPLGDQIRIDAIRELRRDLHMRPFEAERRVYLVFDARPDERGRRRRAAQGPRGAAGVRGDRARRRRARAAAGDDPLALPARAVPPAVGARGPRGGRGARARARRRSGDRARARRRRAGSTGVDAPARPGRGARREALLEVARDVYGEPAFEPTAAAAALVEGARERGRGGEGAPRRSVEGLDLTAREAEQRVRRAQRGAEREELLAALEELEAGTATSSSSPSGPSGAVVHVDRLAELREDATSERLVGAERAAEAVRETWRKLEEFNLRRSSRSRPCSSSSQRAGGVEVARRSAGQRTPCIPPAELPTRLPRTHESAWLQALRKRVVRIVDIACNGDRRGQTSDGETAVGGRHFTFPMAALPAAALRSHPGPAPAADVVRDLYERYSRQLLALCVQRLGNREDAEDALQSTFLNAFRAGRGVTPEHELAWLYKIAENVCLTRQRSFARRRRVETPGDLDALQDVLPARQPDADELLRLPDALQEISERQRRALLLREWQGLSYREIGAVLDMSQSAVETLLFRARRSLARALRRSPSARMRR